MQLGLFLSGNSTSNICRHVHDASVLTAWDSQRVGRGYVFVSGNS